MSSACVCQNVSGVMNRCPAPCWMIFIFSKFPPPTGQSWSRVYARMNRRPIFPKNFRHIGILTFILWPQISSNLHPNSSDQASQKLRDGFLIFKSIHPSQAIEIGGKASKQELRSSQEHFITPHTVCLFQICLR